MGRPLNFRVWARRSLQAAFVGTYEDPAGMPACVFADARSGRAIGPLNLRLGRRTPFATPAPRVGAPPNASPGRLGVLEFYRVEWAGQRAGPDAEDRGVFLRFEPGPDAIDLRAGVVDGLLLGLLGLEARLAALREPQEIERAVWGLILSKRGDLAERLSRKTERARELADVLRWVFGERRSPLPPSAFQGWELVEPGVFLPLSASVGEPDAGPFAPGPFDLPRFLRAGGDELQRATLRALPGAVEGEAIALGADARGRLALAPGPELPRWCAPREPEGIRFGDVLRLIRLGDRIAWAEEVGRNEAARAAELLRADGSTRAKALLARAAERGACAWAAWDGRGVKIREALSVNPSVEHARRLEPYLPGEADSTERLRGALAAAAVYWRAGAFEDAWILLGRLPKLLPETDGAPVLRAARLLHRLLEGRHVHDASEEERDELSYVWDGTLGPVIDDLGQPLSGRCAEVLENAGL